jgi:hypothetical protein
MSEPDAVVTVDFVGATGSTGGRRSELRTSGRLLDNSVRFLRGSAENETSLLLTIRKHGIAFWLLSNFGEIGQWRMRYDG